MIRRPPRSTLFPYTRSSDLLRRRRGAEPVAYPSLEVKKVLERTLGVPRSEEHTSELQSRLHLVCRLLLEKKKKPLTARVRGERQQRSAATHSSASVSRHPLW